MQRALQPSGGTSDPFGLEGAGSSLSIAWWVKGGDFSDLDQFMHRPARVFHPFGV